ncbi:MAG: DsbC family protein [Gallionella sp.]
MKGFLKKSLLVAAMGMAFNANAATPEERVMQLLTKKYPATHVTSVNPSNISGVYEIVMGKNIAYTDSNADYLLFGHLYEMKTQRDITADHLAKINKIRWADLPLKDAFKTVHGNGKRKVAVFSDPDCPYCKKAEATMAALKNVTIYTFLFPIAQLHPQSTSKAISIWCAKKPVEAWRDWMISGAAPVDATCANPIVENIELAKKLGITGTPTMIAKDGTMKRGAAPLAELNIWLK